MRFVLTFVTASILCVGTQAWAADGAAIYGAQCAKCHGASGQSDTPAGKAMKAPVLSGKSLTDAQLTAVLRENPKHSSVSSKVSDADIAALAEFLATLGGSDAEQ